VKLSGTENMTEPTRIDTHHHIVPPAYRAWLQGRGVTAGGLPIPEWSLDGALDLMDAAGVRAAVMSVSTPGVHLGDDAEARDKAREVNEYAAGVVRKHPQRFGFFATLTLPDLQGAIAEAAHALDVLKADGVVLLTNVNGVYFGDASLEPLMAALNERRAVVFIHPSHLPAEPVPGIPPFAADFLLDTTRAAINYAKSGALERHPDLKIILSHAGGFLPYAAERVARVCSPDGQNAGGIARLRKFWFDTALSSSPYALPSLLAFADPGRITFGSDWPYAPKARSLHFAGMLDAFDLQPGLRRQIDCENAQTLFPRFAAS
jgi:predicted TIM-barrel fold metal-dependent hydrolase